MTRFKNSFANVVTPKSQRTGSIDISLVPSGKPIEIGTDITKTISDQIRHFAQLGLTPVANLMKRFLPDDGTKILSLMPEYAKGMAYPLTQQTMIQIAINTAFGNLFSERFNMVKAYLVIAKAESNFNPNPKSSHFGQLQFDAGTGKAAYKLGLQLIKSHKLLQFTQSFMQKYHQSKTDNEQVLMNTGQIFRLRSRIIEQWMFSPDKGWIPKPEIANHPVTKQLIKAYPAILKNRETGIMALMTVYHTDGLYCFSSKTHEKLAYPHRVAEAVVDYYKLGRVPGLPKYILSKLPQNLGLLFSEKLIGDTDPDEAVGIDTNSWWKAIVPFTFSAYPQGTGKQFSGYGERGRVFDKSSKKWTEAHFHHGIDYSGVTGQPVFALFDGHVTKSVNNGDRSYGNEMQLTDRVSGKIQRVGHLSRRFYEVTSPETQVKKGEILGLVGETGLAEGPHLHLEVLAWPSKQALPPNKWGVNGINAINARNT